MVTGSVTLNGISDADLIMILKEKEKNPTFIFNPSALQQLNLPPGAKPGLQKYNHCQLTWSNDEALKAVYVILHKLIHGHDKEPAV